LNKNFKDITGKKFGRLTAIKPVGNKKDKGYIWLFSCDCGNYCEILGSSVRGGHASSCGCYHKEIIRKDLSGERFGNLVVIKRTGRICNTYIEWLVVCDCGKQHKATSGNLLEGRVKSCGCLQRRKGMDSHSYKHGLCKDPSMIREYNLKYYHGINKETYTKLFLEQGAVCDICKKPPKIGKNLLVDHDHKTMNIRGLLCYKCNTGLGLLGDNIEGLEKAISYLQKSVSSCVT